MVKRSLSSGLPSPKRRVLGPNTGALNISPPVTPEKNRVVDVIGAETGDENSSPRRLVFATPPTTPTKPKTAVYSRAKALFQRGALTDCSAAHLTGRKAEADDLNRFLTSNLAQKTPGSLYVSGPPGTGKTAQLNMSLHQLAPVPGINIHKGTRFRVIKVNCMAVAQPENIFHEIYSALSGTHTHSNRKTFSDLVELLNSVTDVDAAIVMLDEMDCLVTKDQQVLFQLFNCASARSQTNFNVKLVLIGISNALDLTDKFLPRLKTNGLSPESLQFLPYTADQTRAIINDKLWLLAPELASAPIMHPAAVLLCCKKSASITGDLRKAFDICYKSIELVEEAYRRAPTENIDFENAPKVTISHVAKICATSFGDNASTKLTNLNLLQKAVLCALFNHQINNLGSSAPPTVNSFFDYYEKHSHATVDSLLSRLRKGDFLEIVSALESTSVVTLSNRSSSLASVDIGNKHIRSNVPYDDLEKAIGGVGVLRRLLHGA